MPADKSLDFIPLSAQEALSLVMKLGPEAWLSIQWV